MKVTVTWYDESGIRVANQPFEVAQTLAEPWLLLEEVLSKIMDEYDLYSYFIVITDPDQKTSRLYTPYHIKNRKSLQDFRIRALKYNE